MSNRGVRGFTRMELRPRNFDAKADLSQKSYLGRLSSGILYHLQNWTRFNDQICFTRKTGVFTKDFLGREVKEVETLSTGVTAATVQRFINGDETVADDVKKMLETGLGQDLSEMSEESLKDISKILLGSERSLEVIEQILSSKELVQSDAFKLLASYPEFLKNKMSASSLERILKLSTEMVQANSPKGILMILTKCPNLAYKLKPEVWKQILASDNSVQILEALMEHYETFPERDFFYPIKLLDNGNLTPELWGQIISSNNPVTVIQAFERVPDLLKTENLTPELQNQIIALIALLPSSSRSIYPISVRLLDCLKDGKLTPDLLTKIRSFPEPIEILKLLRDIPVTLSPDELSLALDSKNPMQALENLRDTYKYGKYLTIASEGYSRPGSNEEKVFLNKDQFINDETMDLWNNLPQREGGIDDISWTVVSDDLDGLFDTIYPDRPNEKDRLVRFLGQCMESADATASPAGEQMIRKRVTAVVDALKAYHAKMENPDLSKPEQEKIKKMIEGALDKLAMGGSACPDNAIVLLRLTENHIKLFEYPQYLANVIVNMFKLEQITETLIDKDYAENVETYLSYARKLSHLLGLGVTEAMIYEKDWGKTEPLEIALPKLSAALTEERLIKYTAELEEFRTFFETEKDQALKAKQQEYMGTYDMDDEKQAAASRERIDEELKDIETSFFTTKARQIFLDTGFFVTKQE